MYFYLKMYFRMKISECNEYFKCYIKLKLRGVKVVFFVYSFYYVEFILLDKRLAR